MKEMGRKNGARLLIMVLILSQCFMLITGQLPSFEDVLMLGSCEEFDNQPTACQGVMVGAWSSVWTVPAYGLSQEYWNAQMNIIQDVNGPPLPPIDLPQIYPYDCAIQYLKLICPTYLRPCTIPDSASGIPFPAIPHPVCRSVCDEFNTVCGDFLATNGAPLFDCSVLDPLTGSPLYPPADANPSLGPFYCIAINNTEMGPVDFHCPPPTEFNPNVNDPTKDTACQPPCLTLIEMGYSDPDLIHQIFVTWSVINWVSFVLIIITIVVFVIFPSLRAWPHRIIIYMAFSLFIVHLSAVGASFYTLSELQCHDTFYFNHAGWCKFQTLAMYFGSISMACWWLVQGIIIFWNITLLQNDDDRMRRLEPLFHVICWSYPLAVAFILSFVPDGMESSGGAPTGLPFCVAYGDSGVQKGLLWGLFTSIFIVFIFANLILVGSALFRIVWTNTGSGQNKDRVMKKRLPAQILIMFFMLVYLNVLIAFIAITSNSTANSPGVQESYTNYFNCILTTIGPLEDCTMTEYFNSSISFYAVISAGTTGIFFAIIYLVIKVQSRREIMSMFTSTSGIEQTSSK